MKYLLGILAILAFYLVAFFWPEVLVIPILVVAMCPWILDVLK